MTTDSSVPPRRTAIVLSGGGARGAYEAGVLSYLFEHVYPELPPGFEFDIVSGTSVGAIHAGYLAASARLDPADRARRLVETWSGMALDDVLKLTPSDWFGIPMRALGLDTLRRGGGEDQPDVIGGLVDLSPLERLVDERIPWESLRDNLAAGRPHALCVSCTDIYTGQVTVFVDGAEFDPSPWDADAYAHAIQAEITSRHVRASAAIPFLFPAVRIGDGYYLDGGLRFNTPLSPALRMGADKVLVIGLKCSLENDERGSVSSAKNAITKPAFVLGKMLNVLILDQIEHDLRRIDMLNSILGAVSEALGPEGLAAVDRITREKRGLEYRQVATTLIRPSRDIGALAAASYHASGLRSKGMLPRLLARSALHGVPEEEADLFSYLYFDAAFTQPLIELGQQDARHQHDEIVALLTS